MKKRTLQIGLGSLREAAQDFLTTAQAVQRGERPPLREQLDFADLPTLLQALTPERWRLIEYVSQHGPLSVLAAAQGLERNYKNVHSDAKRLLALGLLEKAPQGGIWVPYEAIVTELRLRKRAA